MLNRPKNMTITQKKHVEIGASEQNIDYSKARTTTFDMNAVYSPSKFSQLEFQNNQRSMISDLKKIQSMENSNIQTNRSKGSIYSRYSKSRESVIHYFSLLKPEASKSSSIFLKRSENHSIDSKRNTIKDMLYTNEQLIDIAINILHKPINYRNHHDIKMLVKSTENIAFFQNMIKQDDRETHEQCCRYMTLKHLNSGNVVFQEGSWGTTFYIILKGSVSIYISDNNPAEENNQISPNLRETTVEKNIKNKNKTKKELFLNDNHNKKEDMKMTESILIEKISRSKDIKEKSPLIQLDLSALKKIKTLNAGASFGELALMEKKPRAATIICETDCDFAVLEKDYFNWILKEKEEKNLFQQIEFLVSMKLFSTWSYHSVKKLFLAMEQIELQNNKAVFYENDSPDYMYIIKSGEFKVMKTLSYSKRTDTLQKEIQRIQYSTTAHGLSILKNPLMQTKSFEIALLQKGEYFGEEELLTSQKRKITVICSSSSGILYLLNKEEFTKRIMNDEKTLEILKTQLISKKDFYSSRIQQFIKTSKEMHASLDLAINSPKEIKDKSEDFLLIGKEEILKNPKKAKIKRLNFSNNILNPEDVIKTLQDSEKMKLLGFSSKHVSPKQKFFMLKTFAKWQNILKEKENEEIGKQMSKKKSETIYENKVNRNTITSNIEVKPSKISQESNQRDKKRKRSKFNSFFTLPVKSQDITEFLKNRQLDGTKTPNVETNRYRNITPTNNNQRNKKNIRINTWNSEIEIKEQNHFGEKEIDLPLKYHSEFLKNKSKRTLRKYLGLSPTNTQFFKTVSCFMEK